MYGQELILDLDGIKVSDPNTVITPLFLKVGGFCNRIVQTLGLTPLGFHYDESLPGDRTWGNPKTQGISAILFIVQSSITIHWLPLLDQVFINVFSCKTFDPRIVIELADELFKPKTMKTKMEDRGSFNNDP